MAPNPSIPPPFPEGDNQFDFILNGAQKPKKTLLPTANSRKQRILVAVGGGLLFFAILAVLFAVIFSGGDGASKSLLAVAQTQTEITRVSDAGVKKSRDSVAQGLAETVFLAITTNQQQTVTYLKSQGVKADTNTLALGKSTKTDAALESAAQAGRYDDVLISTLKKMLADYKVQLTEAYKQAGSRSQQNLLKQLFNQAEALTKNQPATSS